VLAFSEFITNEPSDYHDSGRADLGVLWIAGMREELEMRNFQSKSREKRPARHSISGA
jgi:hypothetical protein